MAFKKLIPLLMSVAAVASIASERSTPDENFMLVLREVEGANKQDFGFEPAGAATGTLNSGEKISLDPAWFDVIGDMHVRFVIDGEQSMRNLSAKEFAAFGLTPAQAVDIAMANIKKRYGAPQSTPWGDGIIQVAGGSADLDSSYFLDAAFWDELSKKHPDGLVVGVPQRGGLIYAPAADAQAVDSMERSIRSLYEAGGSLRVSSALYLYKNGKWSVFRKPATAN